MQALEEKKKARKSWEKSHGMWQKAIKAPREPSQRLQSLLGIRDRTTTLQYILIILCNPLKKTLHQPPLEMNLRPAAVPLALMVLQMAVEPVVSPT